MLSGGFMSGSSTLIHGNSCTGKSMLALALANNFCINQDKVAYLMLDETEVMFKHRAESVGIDFTYLQNESNFNFVSADTDTSCESLMLQAFRLIEVQGCKMLVIDSIQALLAKNSARPTSELWESLRRYCAKNGTILISTLGSKDIDPLGIADTVLQLSKKENIEGISLQISAHRYGEKKRGQLQCLFEQGVKVGAVDTL
jgi:archaellum biogenesis ATPase FlaH